MLRQESNSVWFYQHRKGELGPVDSDELRFLALTGKVKADTLIRAEGSEDWIPYSESPAALVQHAKELRENTTSEPSPSNSSPEAETDAALPSAAGKHASDSPPMSVSHDIQDEEKGLRIVSIATVLALLLLLALLSALWLRDPAQNKVAGHGSSGQEGSTRGDAEDFGGKSSAEASGEDASRSAAGAAQAESSEAQKADEFAEAELPSSETAPATAPADVSESENASMVDEESPVVKSDPIRAPDPKANAEADPERFSVGLAQAAEPEPREKQKAKPNASRTMLQQSDLSARSGEGRQQAIEDSGGTVESEKAVARALEWLRRIQRLDGSWDFQDVGQDAQRGTLHSPLGATAMATLCFLGSGSTTRTGPDKERVKRAFEFMVSQEGAAVQGNDSMYVHALVTLCLTELVTMEPDEKKYRKHAEDAMSYIQRAQDPTGGGWRYTFQSPGDTSVTGWNVMALQSGQTGGIKVDPAVVNRAQLFLDLVSDSGGATYAYTPGSPSTLSMTAVGLLCRMYLGWPHDSGPLREGIHRLSTSGVSRDDMYYNYYATIALHHYGGTEWKQWNATMRDQLVATQVMDGPAAGSWNVTDPHGGSGGQIYQTCLSVLTLEVYYRYLPLYRP